MVVDHTRLNALLPRLYGEILPRIEESPPPPFPPYSAKLPRASQLSRHFLIKLGEPLTRETKVVSAGSPFIDGRVILLAGPTFLHVSTLAHPPRSTRLRRDNQSICASCWPRSKGSTFFSYKRYQSWLGWEVDPLSGNNFSSYKRSLSLRAIVSHNRRNHEMSVRSLWVSLRRTKV